MFLKNKNIIFKIRRSKVTDYAALILRMTDKNGYCVINSLLDKKSDSIKEIL